MIRCRPSTLTAWLPALVLGLGGLALVGCGADDASTADAPATSAAAADDHGGATAVELEPAYPEEVSPEGLTAEDVRQQEMPHGHDDADHAHDDADHVHDAEGHAHDDEGGAAHAHDDEGEDHAHDDRGEDHGDHDGGGHAH